MGTKASALLALAVSQLGEKEFPPGTNRVKYNTAYYGHPVSGKEYPWCVAFVWWLFREAGASALFCGGEKTASCTAVMNFAKVKGLWVTSGYREGDLVLYQIDRDAPPDHCGIVESVGSGIVTAIEGNTSVSGSQDNGGAVCRKQRRTAVILGAYRPAYEPNDSHTVTAQSGLRLREEAGTKSECLAVMPKGAGVTVKEVWAKVEYQGKTGWCSMEWLKET